ncbi:restriction endonuclease [Streptomyces sp. S07_1.15]|uniref:restriction endonuclease n=1 Tax=Streptomyces sp. S07_1.15 TaxID=2873925 RepID=UPI001D151087|nr:restriction endonuclease [Streptomyces sp. S07_1.15]MCC3653925.1 restriction endonuclease [Streptomyces sp. S07_1.15]
MASEADGECEPGAALGWLLSDRAPDLLPIPWLTDRRFEDFVERLLKAQPLLGMQVRHVAKVARWGVPGDKQDGIDLYGRFNDGVPVAWQCKHLKDLTAAKVRKAVDELTFDGAEEIYLVYADVAKVAARNEIQQHPGWWLWDRRDLTAMLRNLPAQAQRDILDEFWDPDIRRLFVEAPDDAFMSFESFTRVRLNPEAVMNDLGPLAGRTDELAAMRSSTDRESDGYRPIVVVVGPGGRGKSRLLIDSLRELRERQSHVPIFCLAPGRVFSDRALAELRIGASVVVIDDAHVEPEALASLLAFARSRDDVQVILATRPSGLRAIREQAVQAGFRPAEQETVSVDELRRTDAERLVQGLTDGVGLRFELRAYLAGQAEHSPHVAVITINLIKRGELTASLAVDAGLRQTVLNRYRAVLAPDVDGFNGATSRKVLATYAAISPVNSDDQELLQQIANFCDLTVIELARIMTSLRDHGVLVAQAGLMRVVPDVVADSVLEEQAAYGDFDTRFAVALWETFGAGEHKHRLATSLGELDWRLLKRGGPSVMDPIWTGIHERVLALPCSQLHEELDCFIPLATTQPRAVVHMLGKLQDRLDNEERGGTPLPEDGDQSSWREYLGLRPIGPDDVRRKLPELYARAAVSEPSLLETALDALWGLRKRDPRPPHATTDHAQRMLDDHLGNLVKLPDPSFPARIVARVAAWLTEPSQGEDVATPLFALKPLLVKERVEATQSAPMTLSMQARSISPMAMRTVRDQSRRILCDQAASNDLRRAGAAVALLGHALKQPSGYFGQPIGSDVILAWEDDDLATVATLAVVGRRTGIPAVRRLVRNALAWSAEHATSPRVMHAALTVVASLDRVAGLEDDIADDILGDRFALGKVDPTDVPSLEELAATQSTEGGRLAELTKENRQAERDEHIRKRVQIRRTKQDVQDDEFAERLLELGTATEILDLLDSTARDVLGLRPQQHFSLWPIWRRIAERTPNFLPELVCEMADADPGPLDRELPYLIASWLRHTPQVASSWLCGAVLNGRTAVKIAIARAFDRGGWGHASRLADVWATGSEDPDPQVANAFLGAAGPYLRATPTEAVPVLLARGISEHAAATAIEGASDYDGAAYGSGLGREDAEAVLRLVARANYQSYPVQTTVAAIVSNHPGLVLDHLAERDAADVRLPDDNDDLGTAFDRRADDLADWVLQRLTCEEDEQLRLGRVLEAAVSEYLTEAAGDAFAARIPNLDSAEIRGLCRVLSCLNAWALSHPGLATAVVERARETGCYSTVRELVRERMHPNRWGGWNGESPELDAALIRARQAAAEVPDEVLRADYEWAADWVQGTIDADRRRHENDTESGWK